MSDGGVTSYLLAKSIARESLFIVVLDRFG